MIVMAEVLTELLVLLVVGQLRLAHSMDNLTVVYEWTQMDFAFESEQQRNEALEAKTFIPENNLPLGLEVYGDRLFVTVPRWRNGVAASLNFINMTSDPRGSPKLRPYPNWQAHRIGPNDPAPEIVSPFRIRADRCHRLWVLDTGVFNILDEYRVLRSSRLFVYDLRDDSLLRMYVLPASQLTGESFLANIAVEDASCEDTFAYLGDLGQPALIVYSWLHNRSWRVKHHFFNMDPLGGEFNVSGLQFQWQDGLFGLALSQREPATLYFHPMVSMNEFSVETRYLRNEALATDATRFHPLARLLGTRGPRAQSSASFYHERSGVLFYALVNLNAVACWRSVVNYSMENQGRVHMDNITMVFPNDIKVDARDNLWVLSDRLPQFMYGKLDSEQINFRIFSAPVADAIRGTTCDSKLVVPASPKTTQSTTDSSASRAGVCSLGLSLMLTMVLSMGTWNVV